MNGRFVSYLRVSTDRQGKSGLGLEAQRAAVLAYLNGGCWELSAEFVEVESGKNNDRPTLAKAINQCRMTGATLLVAKLDRLSRDAASLMNLSKSGIDIRACDMPEANTMMFGIMAIIAQHEREAISRRTKEALAASKARGKVLGGYRGGPVPRATEGGQASAAAADTFAALVGPMIVAQRNRGASLQEIANQMTAEGIKTVRGGAWTPMTVKNIIDRHKRRRSTSPSDAR